MGYEVYTSALADVLCEPSLAMPLTVGMYARWGSGKSFVLRRLQGMNSIPFHSSFQVFLGISSVIFIVPIFLSHVKCTGIDYCKHGLLKRDSQKKNPSILTEKAWSIRDLVFNLRGTFSRGTRRAIPSAQDSSILRARDCPLG